MNPFGEVPAALAGLCLRRSHLLAAPSTAGRPSLHVDWFYPLKPDPWISWVPGSPSALMSYMLLGQGSGVTGGSPLGHPHPQEAESWQNSIGDGPLLRALNRGHSQRDWHA